VITNPLQKTLIALAITQALMLPAQAATISVNTDTDVSAADSLCTLREAVISANTEALRVGA